LRTPGRKNKEVLDGSKKRKGGPVKRRGRLTTIFLGAAPENGSFVSSDERHQESKTQRRAGGGRWTDGGGGGGAKMVVTGDFVGSVKT